MIYNYRTSTGRTVRMTQAQLDNAAKNAERREIFAAGLREKRPDNRWDGSNYSAEKPDPRINHPRPRTVHDKYREFNSRLDVRA